MCSLAFADCEHAELSGYTVDGTFSEYVVSFTNHVTPIPEGFDSYAAASILCAGGKHFPYHMATPFPIYHMPSSIPGSLSPP